MSTPTAPRTTTNLKSIAGGKAYGEHTRVLAPSVNGGPQRAADDLYPVPDDDRFEEADYMAAPDLGEVARALIKAEPARFDHFKGLRVIYLWRRKGGTHAGGRLTLGKCQKPGGLLAYFADAEFVIWVAADHHRERVAGARAGATRFEIEAVVFHEMCHIGIECNEKGECRNVVVPHDVVTFNAEIARYGAWKDDLRAAAATFQQMPLWPEDSAATFVRDMQAMVDDERSGITGVSMTAAGKTATIAARRNKRTNDSQGKEVHMPEINVKLAEGQRENVEIAGITVTATETPRTVDDEALEALEADDRVTVVRATDDAPAAD